MNDTAYNQYTNLYKLPYNILSYLLTNSNNEDLWKLLNYTTPDALNQPNLTLDQKRALIYEGQPISTPYRVFFNALIDDSFTDECALLRIYIYDIYPENNIESQVCIEFDILSHVKVIQLSDVYHSTRTLRLVQNILNTLNGQDIGGIGKIAFDGKAYRYNNAMWGLSNAKNYEGYYLRMSTRIAWSSGIQS